MEDTNSLKVAAGELLLAIAAIKGTRPNPIILIDGRAGSGKSSFSAILQSLLFKEFEQLPKLVHMDDLYQGWNGLREGHLYMVDKILVPIRAGLTATWQEWDWGSGRRGGSDPGNGWRAFDGDNTLIIEGCASVSTASAGLADLRVWIDADAEVRKARFLERDNSKFERFWSTWSAQEDEFFESEKSQSLCEVEIRNQ